MQTVTLIIDKRRELSVKYKKLLENDGSVVIISKNMISAMKFIQDKEPDLIIVSDSMGADLGEYCKEIRALTYNMRPVIVATSKSADFKDRMKILQCGADDFISEPINSEEFVVRMKAHLRREFETNLDTKKMIPNKSYSMRALKRVLSSKGNWACLMISVDNFEDYAEVYTRLASEKLLQTFTAIIISSLVNEDYLGSLSENEFLIITDEVRSEQIANFLTFAFDTVSEKFYSPTDISRGFVIMQGDAQAGKRSEFVHVSIGVVTSKTKKYSSITDLYRDLQNIRQLAKLPTKSNYLIERAKISGENSVAKRDYNKKVLVIDKDEAMTELLTVILRLQGYDAEVVTDFEGYIMGKAPAVVILDAGDNETRKGLEICQKLKQLPDYEKSKVIVTSVFHEKETVLKFGADLYLPKPYEMPTLVGWIDTFVKEVNEGFGD